MAIDESVQAAVSPKQVIARAKEQGVKIVDLRFTDLPGTWQHFSIPLSELTEDIFNEGIGFDGSSIRGFQEINESDMLLVPDANTAMMDPFTEVPTLSLVCNVVDPLTVMDEHLKGIRDRSGVLWMLLIFELWHRNFLEVRGVGKSWDLSAAEAVTTGMAPLAHSGMTSGVTEGLQ